MIKKNCCHQYSVQKLLILCLFPPWPFKKSTLLLVLIGQTCLGISFTYNFNLIGFFVSSLHILAFIVHIFIDLSIAMCRDLRNVSQVDSANPAALAGNGDSSLQFWLCPLGHHHPVPMFTQLHSFGFSSSFLVLTDLLNFPVS